MTAPVIPAAVRRALEAGGVLPLRTTGGVTHLGEGYAASAYRVRVRTTDSADDLVLRLPKPPLARSTTVLRHEVRLLRALERIDLGVETPRDAREVDDGRTFLGTLHRYVEGTPFAAGLRGTARERLCADIGRFLAALHAVPIDVATHGGAIERDLWPDVYLRLIDETLPQLGPAARAWLTQTADEFVRGGGTRHATRLLVHGDIQRKHLLVDEGGALSGVIDFGEAMVADPALDFAGVLNHLGWRDLERVWVSYEAAGGRIDRDAVRRTRFYIAVVPAYRVLYGGATQGPAERLGGLRQFAARSAAATRHARQRRG